MVGSDFLFGEMPAFVAVGGREFGLHPEVLDSDGCRLFLGRDAADDQEGKRCNGAIRIILKLMARP